jgi:hypothetical protein
MPNVQPTLPRALRERLFQFAQAERLTGERALRVASRFERAHGGLILLELAYQTRASVDEVEALAEARGAAAPSVAAWVLSFAVTVFHWFTDLWPRGTRDIYAAMAERTARTVTAAAELRVEALHAGDAEIAAFCVDWMNARSALAGRLTESLAADDADDFAQTAEPAEAHR